jgi:alginate O-acetyltransferase complex protein AlgI
VLFNSLTFLVFFAVVMAFHYSPLPWKAKKVFLLFASYVFYGAWNPPFVILLWLSTILDWYVAKYMDRTEVLSRRRVLLMLSILGNLGMLGYYKYGKFLLTNFQELMSTVGVSYQPPAWDIVLPVGISFYTFQTMAYSLDVYLRRARPTNSFLDFALFVTFFPQLVAGPIVRPTDLIPQFATQPKTTSSQLGWGLMLMTVGLFEKIVVADGLLAPVADAVYKARDSVAPLDAWLGTLAFSGQIFCDFAGYTTTAIGLSLVMGFSLIDNFHYPYAAIGFSDFWRRWHISLSTWLRDYLYIPLGGNRKGSVRTYINLMLTMLLGGLWHGASWTFVVWGGLHGLYLAVERFVQRRFAGSGPLSLPAKIALGLLTYFLVNITWVFFRAQDFPAAWRILRSMLGIHRSGEPILNTYLAVSAAVTIGIMLVIHWTMRNRNLHDVAAKLPAAVVGLIWGVMLFLIVITQGGSNAFIYFQF